MTLKPLLWLLTALGTATAAAGTLTVETAPEQVTLFIDGAQVTRSRQVDLPAGSTVLLFKGLSPYLDEKSMQLASRGPFTVTAIDRKMDYADSAVRSERQRKLTGELERLEKRKKELTAAREVIDARSEMLRINCSVANRQAVTSLAAIRELNDYYAAALEELKRRTLALDEETAALAERERRLRGELAQAGGRRDGQTSAVEVHIEAAAPCKGDFTLTYYVRNAGWFPSYDVRSAGVSAPLELVCKANIFQNTREEWKEVALTLCTSNPTTGNIAPELKTWWLDYGLAPPRYDRAGRIAAVSGIVRDDEYQPVIGASVTIPGTTLGTSTDVEGRYSLTVPPGAEQLEFRFIGYKPLRRTITGERLDAVLQPDAQRLDEVVVMAYGSKSARANRIGAVAAAPVAEQTVEQAELADEASPRMEVARTRAQTDYRFAIRQPYTVPSDGKSVSAEIGRYRLPATYRCRCAPKIDRDVFLTAEVTDWADCRLLEGEANVFFEQTFIGKSILSPREVGDTLRFSLGRDRSVNVERTREQDFTTRRTIGANSTQRVGWKIAVRNTRSEPVSLTLSDQMPVSRNSTIVVTAEELSGGTLDQSTGEVVWRLDLQPGEQRDLRLRYAVKYPKDSSLTVE